MPTKGASLGSQECQGRLVDYWRVPPIVAFHSEAEEKKKAVGDLL